MITLKIEEIDNGFLVTTDLDWMVEGTDKVLYSETLADALNIAIVELGILQDGEPPAENGRGLFD